MNYSNWICDLCPWSNFGIPVPCLEPYAGSQQELEVNPIGRCQNLHCCFLKMNEVIQPFSPLLGAETLETHLSLHNLFRPQIVPLSMRPKLWTDTVHSISCDNADRDWFCAYSWFTSLSQLWMWGDTIPALWLIRVFPPVPYLLH